MKQEKKSGGRTRPDSLMWGREEYTGGDVKQAFMRGFVFLAAFLIILALFLGGIGFPLIEVTILPGAQEHQMVYVKSVKNMVEMCFEKGQYLLGMVVFCFIIGIPMFLFAGMMTIAHENFFSVACSRTQCFSPAARALGVSMMYISTSYQVVTIFLIVLGVCFMKGFASQAELRTGFYFFAGYCVASVAMLQTMELFKSDADEPEDDEESLVIPDITGLRLRRHFSSFFPSLPGIKETKSVDFWQVLCISIIFLVLLLFGFCQPLLEIRVALEGVTLDSRVLSLKDLVLTLGSVAPFPIVALFVFLVVVIPVLYTLVLCCAGIAEKILQVEPINEFLVFVAEMLRPWVMIDVFAIALVILLKVVQWHAPVTVSAAIPDGLATWPRGYLPLIPAGKSYEEGTVRYQQCYSGFYMIVGAGIACIFLRWFWSANGKAEEAESSPRYLADDADPVENRVTRTYAGKSCRLVVVVALACVLLHMIPLRVERFKFRSINHVLHNAVPMANKLLEQYTPRTVGNCSYPAGGIPQPCFEYGILAQVVKSTYKITAMWMSGFDTLRLTNISLSETHTLKQNASVQGGPPVILHRYVLSLDGVLANPSLFLKIEQCPKNHTTLKPVLGQGLCKPFLDTDNSCCENNRHFQVQLSAECHRGDRALGNLHVSDFTMDTMTARPLYHRTHMKALLANQNITKMFTETVGGNMNWYLKHANITISGEELTVVKFINRVLRFSAPHQEFRCS
jgi:uncharacterized paraquat-inducible protein A